MGALGTLLLFVVSSGSIPTEWENAELGGWKEDGSEVAFYTYVASKERRGGDVPLGQLIFVVGTDPNGRPTRLYRDKDGGPYDPAHRGKEEDPWTETREGKALWERAESEEAGEAWLAAGGRHTKVLPKIHFEHGEWKATDRHGKEPLTAELVVVGGTCKTVKLEVTIGARRGTAFEDGCHAGDDGLEDVLSQLELSWSPDGTRAAMAWQVDRWTVGRGNLPRTQIGVVTKRSLAGIDLLDAGASTGLGAVAERLGAEGFRVAHQGKATTPRNATEIYFAPGYEVDAREAAKLLGIGDAAVKPLTWKTPYPITIAAGARAE